MFGPPPARGEWTYLLSTGPAAKIAGSMKAKRWIRQATPTTLVGTTARWPRALELRFGFFFTADRRRIWT